MTDFEDRAEQLAEQFVTKLPEVEVKRLYEEGPSAVCSYCFQWAGNACRGIRDEYLEQTFGKIPRSLLAAKACRFLTDLARDKLHEKWGVPVGDGLISTPPDLAIKLNTDQTWPEAINCPMRLPRTARFIGSTEWSMPYHSGGENFFLTTNRIRKHWILWINSEDEMGRQTYVPIAWCRRDGIRERDAAIFLVRAWWAMYEVAPGYILDGGLISFDDLASLMQEIRPDSDG